MIIVKEYFTEILAGIGFIWAIIESLRNYKFKKAEQIRNKKLDAILKLQEKVNEIKFLLFKFLKEFVIETEQQAIDLENLVIEKENYLIELKNESSKLESETTKKKKVLEILSETKTNKNQEDFKIIKTNYTLKTIELFNSLYKNLDNNIQQISLIALNGLISKTKLDETLFALTQEISKFQIIIKKSNKSNLEDEDWEKVSEIFDKIVLIEKEIKKEIG